MLDILSALMLDTLYTCETNQNHKHILKHSSQDLHIPEQQQTLFKGKTTSAALPNTPPAFR